MGWLKDKFGSKPKTPEAPFTEVTDSNFQQEVMQSDRPVMLFVWSNTCPHCKAMAPNIKKTANRFPETIKATHTNSALAPRAMASLDVRGVPATIFVHQGKLVEYVTGFRPESFLAELIESHFPEQPTA